MNSDLLPKTTLRLVPFIEFQATADAESFGEPFEEGDDKVSKYCDDQDENLSESSGQIRPAQDYSGRAFARLVRLDSADEKRVRGAIGRPRNFPYGEQILSMIVTDALGFTPEFGGPLKAAMPNKRQLHQRKYHRYLSGVRAFYPNRSYLELKDTAEKLGRERANEVPAEDVLRHFLGNLARSYAKKRITPQRQATINFAGLFKLNPKEVDEIVQLLRDNGLTNDDQLRLVLADLVVATIKNSPRLTQGIAWSQPSKRDSESTDSDSDDSSDSE